MLVRTVECLDGRVEVEITCEPMFDYGRIPATWELVGDRHTADGDRRRSDAAPADGHGAGHRGRPDPRPARCSGPATWRYGVLSWADGLAAPADHAEAAARVWAATSDFWRTWLAGARIPDHRWRDSLQRSALVGQGADVHADRRHRRRA